MTYRTAGLGFGACFVVLAFISLLVAVTTNYWLSIQVNREQLQIQSQSSTTTTLAAYSRNRGLFRECFKDAAATRTQVTGNAFVDETNQCLKTDFTTNRINVFYTAQYRMRANLQIAMVIFLCFALVLCVCGFAVFCYSASLSEHMYTKRWGLTTKWAGILIFIAAFFNALGMAFYHGAEYLETELITTNEADAPYDLYFKLAQPSALQNATSRSYSWSYALSWVAVFFEILAAVFWFICGACCLPRRAEKGSHDFNTLNSTRSYGQRNMAYEYMEGKNPVTIYEAQPPHMISDGSYHDHFQGRHFDPYHKAPAQVSRTQYNYNEGGWSW